MMLVPTVLALVFLSAAQGEAALARPWEHESSDLTVNPRIQFGRLANGLRYAWLRNAEPKERCYVRLHVDAGALAEEDAEDGLAHFLEHMAFNGSEHYAAGTLVEWFQEHGMAFGADLNALTNYWETVYHLDLPSSDRETLSGGLTVLRDWADGLLLEETEIEKEKGVVDAEQAAGDTAGRRVFERLIAEQYDGTRYELRDIIGEKSVRAAFTPAGVRAFYERWYRPELFTLIVVGDLGELDPAPLIAEHFADLEAPKTPLPAEPPVGRPELVERFFAIHEPEIPSVSVNLERLKHFEDEPDTKATRTDEIDLAAARRMLNQRFEELLKKEGTPFLDAAVDEVTGLEVYEGESLSVTSTPERWEEAFAAAEAELRRAIEFGFAQPELDEVRANWRRSLDEAVEREPTRDSRAFVRELLVAAEDRSVPTDAAASRALVLPVIDALTVEACQKALAKAWSSGVVNLYTTGSLDLGERAGEVLKAAYERARERKVEKAADVELAEFAYASKADEAGAITAEEHVEDLDLWLFTFENGVRLNVKVTDFKEREIQVAATVSEGLLTIPPEDFAVAWVGSQAVNFAGLGKHSVDDLRRLTAGRRVGVGFGLTNEAFRLAGTTTAEDLLLELELLRAALADPGWRDDGVRLLRDRLPLVFEQLAHVPSGPLYLEFLPKLFHGDQRFCDLPERGAIEKVEMKDVREWLAPHLADGPVELTIVGDVELEAARTAVARTLGTLPPRRAWDPRTARRDVKPPEPSVRVETEIETEDDKSFVLVVVPTGDGRETARRRGLNFLSQVVQDRLRVRVREELGAAYSPGASATPNETFPGVGLLMISASLPPEETSTFADAALAIVRELVEKGVAAEEVQRLAEPILAQIRDAKRNNGYWIEVLAECQRHPHKLDDAREVESFYRTLDPEKLSALAASELDPEKASLLIVSPKGDEPKGDDQAPVDAGAGDDGG